ncbi:hypothetical protein MD484_g2439, partial [Candolleomyces efflorescens]
MDTDWMIVNARARYANFSMTMVVIGIHVFMAIYGLSVFLETPEHLRKGRKRYIATSFLITMLAAFTASLDMSAMFHLLLDATSPLDHMKLISIYASSWKAYTSNTGLAILVLVGDALLVYRCYIICIEYWWVTILPAATCLSAFVLFLVGTYIGSEHAKAVRACASGSIMLTVATNLIVTTLIAVHLIRARRTLSKLIPSSDMKLYTGIVAILIESALPLSVFGIIAGVLTQVSLVRSIALAKGFSVSYHFFAGLFYWFCTLSPHMIIFRVTTGRSFTKFPTIKGGGLSRPIAFAQHTAGSSFLESSLPKDVGGEQQISTQTARKSISVSVSEEKGSSDGGSNRNV